MTRDAISRSALGRGVARSVTRSVTRGFTLVELLIVIGIIGVLVATTLLVGNAAVGSARKGATEDTLRVLDSALEQYIAAQDGIPPATVADPRPGRTAFIIPVADVRSMDDIQTAAEGSLPGNPMIDSLGLFLIQAKAVPGAKSILDQLPTKIVQVRTNNLGGLALPLSTVVDGWGSPIRYVHPQFSGRITPAANINSVELLGPAPTGRQYSVGLVRRNNTYTGPDAESRRATQLEQIADGDGGKCVGGRPYFYSAGPDKDPSTIEDNVYLSVPPVPRV